MSWLTEISLFSEYTSCSRSSRTSRVDFRVASSGVRLCQAASRVESLMVAGGASPGKTNVVCISCIVTLLSVDIFRNTHTTSCPRSPRSSLVASATMLLKSSSTSRIHSSSKIIPRQSFCLAIMTCWPSEPSECNVIKNFPSTAMSSISESGSIRVSFKFTSLFSLGGGSTGPTLLRANVLSIFQHSIFDPIAM